MKNVALVGPIKALDARQMMGLALDDTSDNAMRYVFYAPTATKDLNRETLPLSERGKAREVPDDAFEKLATYPGITIVEVPKGEQLAAIPTVTEGDVVAESVPVETVPIKPRRTASASE